MDGRTGTGYTLSYTELVEDENGLYRLGDHQEFDIAFDEFETTARGFVTTT